MPATTPTPFRAIQFGTGNFLRGFIGPMFQQWAEQSQRSIETIVVKPTASNPASFQAWIQQDGRYHVLTKGQQEGQLIDEITLIEHIARMCHPYQDFSSYLALAKIDAQCIISNTTEAGLSFTPTNAFSDTPASSFPGKLTQLLHARWTYTQGDLNAGYDILPCELVERNGERLRSLVLQYCEHWQLPLAFTEWVQQANRFYNNLVDRIVPGRPELDEALRSRLLFPDQNVVQVEPYLLWAIEATDNLAARLPLSELGLNVIFTPDIQRYQTLKVSILNGAHTAMTMWGLYHGIVTVAAFMKHPAARNYLDHLLTEDILPSLAYPEAEKVRYQQDVYDRFENPFIQHRLHDISLNSVAKFNSRLLPSMWTYEEQFGTLPKHLVTALTLLIRNYRGDRYPLRDEATVLEAFAQHWSAWEPNIHLPKWVDDVLRDERLWELDLSARFPNLAEACAAVLLQLLTIPTENLHHENG